MKTKDWYIMREIRYDVGDQILFSELEEVMVLIKSDLRKTNLFVKIEVEALFSYEEKAEVVFRLNLDENWFIYPSIAFELVDRNFNVWWEEYNHSLKRINLGLGIDHANFTGANDKIKLSYHFGYSTRASLNYSRPAISANSKMGIKGAFHYGEFKEFGVITEKDKPFQVKDDDGPLYIKREFSMGIRYKKNKFWNYELNLEMNFNRFKGIMALTYPDFFLKGDSIQNYEVLNASVAFVDLDHRLKPTRGYSIIWNLTKTGLGFLGKYNYLSLTQHFKTSRKLFNRCYLINGIYGKFAIDRGKRPYNLYKSLSYNDTNISGYELYVINGLDHLFINNELRYSLAKFHWKLFKILKNEPILRIASELEMSCQANAAYVNDPFYNKNNHLVNTLLYSTGIGLNFTINDVFEFNVIYSLNHLKETGFYFHTRKAF